MIDDETFEDRVLLANSGPAFVFIGYRSKDESTGKEALGIGIRLTGRDHVYEPYQAAAMRLCRKGLLLHSLPNGEPIDYYEFTERGRIAHWALREAFKR